MQAWHQIDDKHDSIRDDECPRDTDRDPGDLLAQLDPITVTGASDVVSPYRLASSGELTASLQVQ